MARIINFYVPISYRRKVTKAVPPTGRGKLISFTLAALAAKRKSA